MAEDDPGRLSFSTTLPVAGGRRGRAARLSAACGSGISAASGSEVEPRCTRRRRRTDWREQAAETIGGA
eukprot:gene1102-310_t